MLLYIIIIIIIIIKNCKIILNNICKFISSFITDYNTEISNTYIYIHTKYLINHLYSSK